MAFAHDMDLAGSSPVSYRVAVAECIDFDSADAIDVAALGVVLPPDDDPFDDIDY